MKRLDYEALAMEEIVVEMEEGFLASSGKPATISEESTITVEEYETIDNKITFD